MSFESEGEQHINRIKWQLDGLYEQRRRYEEEKIGEEQRAFDEAEEALDEAVLELHQDAKFQALTEQIKLAEGELKRLKEFLRIKEPK